MEAYGEQPPTLDGAQRKHVRDALRHNAAHHRTVVWTRRSVAAAALIAAAVMLTERPETGRHAPETVYGKQESPVTANVIAATGGTAQSASATIGRTTAEETDRTARAATEDYDDNSRTATRNDTVNGSIATATAAATGDNHAPEPRPRHGTYPPRPQLPDGIPQRRARGNIAVGAYMANAAMSSSRTAPTTPMLAAAAPIGKYSADMKGNDGGEPIKSQSVSETTVRHHQPVRLGLSVRYCPDNRWSIETGLTYCYLHSEITQRTAHYSHTDYQRLHYVGIPVGVSYTFMRSRSLAIYVTANVMAEKCVGGTESVSRPQLSAGAALGAELRLGDGVGIYAEPGISHYFDNHGSTATIYHDKPTGMSLSVGIRLNLRK